MAEDRSLSSGMSFPQWMKTRMNDRELTLSAIIRLNFDQTALSPPENDDNFLYIRYNRAATSIKPSNTTGVNINNDVIAESVKPIAGKIKSSGTDDGFKGEAAQCGSSIIRVAHQMVSAKLTKGLTIPEEDFATEPEGFNRALRRGSKSLPSSPLSSPNTSPKSRRRHVNRYFSSNADTDKIQGSWILSGLLRKHDRLSHSVNVINEEENIHESLTKTLSQVSLDEASEVKVPKQKKVKPSELREMNFWSPTSM